MIFPIQNSKTDKTEVQPSREKEPYRPTGLHKSPSSGQTESQIEAGTRGHSGESFQAPRISQ